MLDDAREGAAGPPPDVREHPAAMSVVQVRAGLVAAGLLVLAGLYTVHEFLPALLWAVVLTIAVWPLFERAAHRWPQHRKLLLPSLVVLGVLLVFVAPVTLAAVPLARDAHSLAAWLDHARTAGVPAPGVLDHLPFGARLHAEWDARIGQPGQVSDIISRTVQGRLLGVGQRLGAEALHRLVLGGFMLLTLFLLLRQADEVAAQVRRATRRAFGPAGENVARQMVLSVHGTVNGLVLVGLAVGAIISVVYMAVGVPHAALFGLLTALLAIVPFGAAAALTAATVALLVTGKVVGAVVVAVVGGTVVFVADHFARPVLIGRATRLLSCGCCSGCWAACAPGAWSACSSAPPSWPRSCCCGASGSAARRAP